MELNNFGQIINDNSKNSTSMPVLFIGHGSPMNAIEDNDFTKTLQKLGPNLPKPTAILCISAHWMTKGTYVNISPFPKIIYDMYGFPRELYQVVYPAKGSPETAKELQRIIHTTNVQTDTEWGFDHGSWSIVKHIFPEANIPLFQMSIDYDKPMQYHYDLAKEMLSLRSKGVLIIGSGNITHNLSRVDFSGIDAPIQDWAYDFDNEVKQLIDDENHQGLIDYKNIGSSVQLAVPEPSHYIPLIYTIGLQNKGESPTYLYDKFQYGTLSMRCIQFG